MYRSPRLVDVPVMMELPSSMYKAPVMNTLGDVDLGQTYYPSHGECKVRERETMHLTPFPYIPFSSYLLSFTNYFIL